MTCLQRISLFDMADLPSTQHIAVLNEEVAALKDELAALKALKVELAALKEEQVGWLFKETELERQLQQKKSEIEHKDKVIELMRDCDKLRATMLKQQDEEISGLKSKNFHIQDVSRLREDVVGLRREVDSNDFGRRRRDDELHSFTVSGDNHLLKRARRIERHLNLESPSP